MLQCCEQKISKRKNFKTQIIRLQNEIIWYNIGEIHLNNKINFIDIAVINILINILKEVI